MCSNLWNEATAAVEGLTDSFNDVGFLARAATQIFAALQHPGVANVPMLLWSGALVGPGVPVDSSTPAVLIYGKFESVQKNSYALLCEIVVQFLEAAFPIAVDGSLQA